MKLFWNELKLRFKEQLRVVGKYDFNRADDYLVKRRKFKDIDIAKDFENRLKEKKIEDQKENVENNNMDYSLMTLDQLEAHREKMKNKEETERESDLYRKIILTDIHKMNILAVIKTHEFFDKFFEDTQLHPEMRKNLELIEYNLKHNLPVEKRILFEAMPEMFVQEIGRLTEDERKRFRRRRFELSAVDGMITTGEQYQMAILNQTYENDKIHEMKLYALFQRQDFYQKYSLFFQQAKEWGWDHLGEYLYSIRVRDKNSLTSIEKLMLEEILEFDQMDEEILALEKALKMREYEYTLPFPMDEKDKMEWIARVQHIKKFQTLSIYDTFLTPFQIQEETFDDRLKRIPGVDIEEEIRKSREKYMKTINSGHAIKSRDMNTKDPELIRQVNIVSQAIKIEQPFKLENAKYDLPLDYIEEGMLGQTPTDGRILIEEYYKVLYMNNQDPETYNFSYWEKYFGVSKVTLRNIFNYVFFPLPDEKNPSEVGKILYFQDVEFAKKRKMIAEMSSVEYQEYLERTEERPELQEVNRLDYLTYQTTATEPRVTERTVITDDVEIEKAVKSPLIYSEVIKEVDDRIQEVYKDTLENSTNVTLLEKDIQIQLEEIKNRRLSIEAANQKELSDARLAPFTAEEVNEKLKENDKIKLITKEETKVEVLKEEITENNKESK